MPVTPLVHMTHRTRARARTVGHCRQDRRWMSSLDHGAASSQVVEVNETAGGGDTPRHRLIPYLKHHWSTLAAWLDTSEDDAATETVASSLFARRQSRCASTRRAHEISGSRWAPGSSCASLNKRACPCRSTSRTSSRRPQRDAAQTRPSASWTSTPGVSGRWHVALNQKIPLGLAPSGGSSEEEVAQIPSFTSPDQSPNLQLFAVFGETVAPTPTRGGTRLMVQQIRLFSVSESDTGVSPLRGYRVEGRRQ